MNQKLRVNHYKRPASFSQEKWKDEEGKPLYKSTTFQGLETDPATAIMQFTGTTRVKNRVGFYESELGLEPIDMDRMSKIEMHEYERSLQARIRERTDEIQNARQKAKAEADTNRIAQLVKERAAKEQAQRTENK